MVRSNERNHGLLTEKDLSPLNSSGMWEVLPTVLKQRLQLASTKKGDCRRSSRSPVARLFRSFTFVQEAEIVKNTVGGMVNTTETV